jgi:hypothetical protein
MTADPNAFTLPLAIISLASPLIWGALTLWVRKSSRDEASEVVGEQIKVQLLEFKDALLLEFRGPQGFKPASECALIEERNIARLVRLESNIDSTTKRLEDLWMYSHTRIHDSAQVITALAAKLELEVKRLEQQIEPLAASVARIEEKWNST